MAADSTIVSFLVIGEGWHNFHHTFPWDYRTSELGSRFNRTSDVIDLLNWVGLAYNLKTASPDMIKTRALRTGDGTHNTKNL